MPRKNNNIIDIQKYFLLGTLLLLLVVLMLFVSPFLGTLLIATVIVTGVFPVHKILHKKLRIPATFSALISLILVAVLLLSPLTLFFFSIANQATDAYVTISTKINELTSKDIHFIPTLLQNGFVQDWADKISKYAPVTASDIISTAKDFVGKISSIILGQTTNILKNLSLFILHIVIFLLAMFYFLRDGERLMDYINAMLPLSEQYRIELFKKLSRLSHGIIYGIFGAAIAQGFLVGFAFYIVGISNAAFWGAVAALLSPLPYIGTAVVWVPVVIALAVGHHWVAALFLLVWGVVVVSLADNIVKPYLIGSSTALHPLAVLLVLLGGVFTFGLKGLIFGPFILTLTLAFLHIYKLEYKSVLKKRKT
ncbi:AI-2E family transporter [Candidatus Peregrinibacteria bacterium]|nr:AI-2E family transporter [Candidatus Peregrinibacteria bacterium]